jgi:hypothetical protein
MGPPAGLTSFASPTFPQTYAMTQVDPGDYTVFAFLDEGNNNPQMPGPEDPTGLAMAKAHVTDTAPGTADVALGP